MIRIEKNISFREKFTKELKKYLSEFLDQLIENKKLLGQVRKVDNSHVENKDVNVYFNHEDGTRRFRRILFRIGINDIGYFQYIKKNLNLILNAESKELMSFIQSLKSESNKFLDPNTDIFKIIKYIFADKGYEYKITTMNKKRIAYEFVKNLNIKTCPYCNRNYISFVKNKNKQTRPQLDHYYPKSIYPFLACSFYNLIPSCSACNHMKSDEDSYKDEMKGTLVNPYSVTDKDFKFSYKLNDLKLIEIAKQNEITFEYEDSIDILLDTKYLKNIEYFQLEEIYQNHKDIVIELILKEINYPKSYVDELIRNNFGTKEEIYRFLFSNYLKLDDLHKRPLSKLTKDIVEELGLLERINLAVDERIVK